MSNLQVGKLQVGADTTVWQEYDTSYYRTIIYISLIAVNFHELRHSDDKSLLQSCSFQNTIQTIQFDELDDVFDILLIRFATSPRN